MEDPWPGQTSPYSEQHNAEQHNVKKHNTEKYDAEKHNGQSTTTTHGIYEMKAIFFSPKTGKKNNNKNRQTVKTYTTFYNKMNTISRGKYVIGPGIELTKSKIATTRYGW